MSNLDEQTLWRTRTVEELKHHERAARTNAQNKQVELRSLVNTRYRDLLGSADAIVDMQSLSLQHRQHVASALQHVRALTLASHAAPEQTISSTSSTSYSSDDLRSLARFVAATPDRVRADLDARRCSLAAARLLLARYISFTIPAAPVEGDSSDRKFVDIIRGQCRALESLPSATVEAAADRLASQSRLSLDESHDSLLALALLGRHTPVELVAAYFAARHRALSLTLQRALDAVSLHSEQKGGSELFQVITHAISAALHIFQTTLVHASAIFGSVAPSTSNKSNSESEPLGADLPVQYPSHSSSFSSVLQSATSTLIEFAQSIDAAESHRLMSSLNAAVDSLSQTSFVSQLSSSTQAFLDVLASNSAALPPCLAQRSTNIPASALHALSRVWWTRVQVLLRDQLSRLIKSLNSGEEIAAVRDIVLTQLLVPRQNTDTTSVTQHSVGWHSQWRSACEAADLWTTNGTERRSLCLWTECLASLFSSRLGSSVQETFMAILQTIQHDAPSELDHLRIANAESSTESASFQRELLDIIGTAKSGFKSVVPAAVRETKPVAMPLWSSFWDRRDDAISAPIVNSTDAHSAFERFSAAFDLTPPQTGPLRPFVRALVREGSAQSAKGTSAPSDVALLNIRTKLWADFSRASRQAAAAMSPPRVAVLSVSDNAAAEYVCLSCRGMPTASRSGWQADQFADADEWLNDATTRPTKSLLCRCGAERVARVGWLLLSDWRSALSTNLDADTTVIQSLDAILDQASHGSTDHANSMMRESIDALAIALCQVASSATELSVQQAAWLARLSDECLVLAQTADSASHSATPLSPVHSKRESSPVSARFQAMSAVGHARWSRAMTKQAVNRTLLQQWRLQWQAVHVALPPVAAQAAMLPSSAAIELVTELTRLIQSSRYYNPPISSVAVISQAMISELLALLVDATQSSSAQWCALGSPNDHQLLQAVFDVHYVLSWIPLFSPSPYQPKGVSAVSNNDTVATARGLLNRLIGGIDALTWASACDASASVSSATEPTDAAPTHVPLSVALKTAITRTQALFGTWRAVREGIRGLHARQQQSLLANSAWSPLNVWTLVDGGASFESVLHQEALALCNLWTLAEPIQWSRLIFAADIAEPAVATAVDSYSQRLSSSSTLRRIPYLPLTLYPSAAGTSTSTSTENVQRQSFISAPSASIASAPQSTESVASKLLTSASSFFSAFGDDQKPASGSATADSDKLTTTDARGVMDWF